MSTTTLLQSRKVDVASSNTGLEVADTLFPSGLAQVVQGFTSDSTGQDRPPSTSNPQPEIGPIVWIEMNVL
jgi:hypothetical protein